MSLQAPARGLRGVAGGGAGKFLGGLSGIDTCLDPLLAKFLETGDPASVDPAGLATMQPPSFATK